MLITLLSAVLKDVMSVTRTEEFFALSSIKRQKQISGQPDPHYPKALCEYLARVSAESFMEDVQGLLPVLTASHGVPGHLLNAIQPSSFDAYPLELPKVSKGSSSVGMVHPAGIQWSEEFLSDIRGVLQEIAREPAEERRPNGFVLAFASFLSEELADAFDQEPRNELILGDHTSSLLENIFRTERTVEFGREAQRFLQEQIGVASPVIQSPYPLSAEQKQEMRTFLRERYPGSFPLFEVEPSLGGGLRLFYQGELLDESWMTQMARLFTRLHVD